ncbi:MAG: carboxypeptidase-like regulatory domain-containing protein [Cyclobacteriaceae bacterium]|nr:carboxypeptidase-like regulatory domain-containing protein [Cyclobacteriaceae bacterium]
MKFYLFIAAFSLLTWQLHAQKVTVSGKVTDKETGEPLPFATVGIVGKPIGTISNLQGEFDFHIPQEYRNDILVINMLGYQSYEAPVWSISSKGQVVIELSKSTTVLNEVVIRDSLSGGDIFRIALDRIEQNYPMTPFMLEGFYRDIKKVANTNISLLEAAVKIYDEDYAEPRNKFKLRERVRLLEVRKSLGYESKFTSYFDQVNLLEDLLLHNDVRYRNFPQEEIFFNQLERMPNTTFHGNEVYVVSLTGEYNLTVYIDKETYGILHLSFENNLMNDDQRKKSMISRFVYVKREITFNKIDNKFYLGYISMNSRVNWYDIKTNELKFETSLYQQLLINQVTPNADERIRSTEKMRNYGLQFQDKPYNKEFWDNYNLIKDTPLDKKVLEDLEKGGSLEKQFEGKG